MKLAGSYAMCVCPFVNPNFDLDFDEPCPVCGAFGYTDPEEINKMCVDMEGSDENQSPSSAPSTR